jgi:hypothetical protein
VDPYPYARTPRPPLSEINYDERAVPAFTLPDPLIGSDGRGISTPEAWLETRRPELIHAFARHVYGRTPGGGVVDVATRREATGALGGLATRIELEVRVRAAEDATTPPLVLHVLIYLPARSRSPSPVFLGLNFFGNHTVHPEPAIRLATGWSLNSIELGVTEWTPTEASRGLRAYRWPVEMILNRGYGLATLYAGDIDPDYDDGFVNGAHGLFPQDTGPNAESRWGSIAAWAWGLSRVRDALESVETIDLARVGLVGHSRMGKAALWAAAQDTRFAWVISSCSGKGGAGLSRRRFGELTRHLNARFPHWMAPSFRAFDGREQALPVDQHELLALIAPRPVYVSTAAADLWTDPDGQLLACRHAAPVYELFGLPDRIGYHRRPGHHDVLPADWWHFLDFVDRATRT